MTPAIEKPVPQKPVIEKIRALLKKCGETFEIGRKYKLLSRGWLSVTDDGSCYSVMYTSDKDSHSPLDGPSICADFNKVTGEPNARHGLTGAWKSALSMWPVRDPQEASRVFNTIETYIDTAYRHHKAGRI